MFALQEKEELPGRDSGTEVIRQEVKAQMRDLWGDLKRQGKTSEEAIFRDRDQIAASSSRHLGMVIRSGLKASEPKERSIRAKLWC